MYNIHKYSISNKMKKEKNKKRKLMTKHGIKDQLWQQVHTSPLIMVALCNRADHYIFAL